MPTKGYDAFFPEPGAYEHMTCRVCGSRCTVRRARIGPTGFNEAMCGVERPHDLFVCPHAGQPWHDEALQLLREAEVETDPLLARALRRRLERLVTRHVAPGS